MTTLDNHVHEQIDKGLYYREWRVENPKAIVLLVHGVSEHCQRYKAIADELNRADYVVSSMDLPNHGRSAGPKGHVDSFDDFQNAVLGLYERVKMRYPDKPIFILGHSMGGLITSRLLLEHQDKFSGALLSGAGIESPQEPPAWQVRLITLISKFFPTAGMLGVDPSFVSRDKAVVSAYRADPLNNTKKLSAKLLVEFFKTIGQVKQGAAVIKLPILIMHGTADRLTAPAGSQWLYETVVSTDKKINLYPGLYHEIFNEPEADAIYQDVITWLDQHVS